MYELILRAVLGTPWAILPEKLAAIESVLAIRAGGGRVTAEEVAAATNGRRGPGQQNIGAVAVIPIYGTIHEHAGMLAESSGGVSVDAIRAGLRAALGEPGVGSILLDVDSPGGSVMGVPELAAEILRARGSKPVVALANSLAASAAYWIASAADEVWVTPSGQVGSIGVYLAHVDMSKAYDDAGVKVSLISAGKYKVEGNEYEPLGDDARGALQALVDEYYEMFVAGVAQGRAVSATTVRGGFGEGRLVTAKAAKAAGMVDGIGTLDEAAGRAARLARARGRAQAEAIRLGVM